METSVLCLVSLSFDRCQEEAETIKLTQQMKQLLKEELNIRDIARYDTMPGSFCLNQDWYEFETYVHTSYGMCVFRKAPKFTEFIQELWVQSKVDIIINYKLREELNSSNYLLHSSFPDQELLYIKED